MQKEILANKSKNSCTVRLATGTQKPALFRPESRDLSECGTARLPKQHYGVPLKALEAPHVLFRKPHRAAVGSSVASDDRYLSCFPETPKPLN